MKNPSTSFVYQKEKSTFSLHGKGRPRGSARALDTPPRGGWQAQALLANNAVIAGAREERGFTPVSTLCHMARQAGNDETGDAGHEGPE
jgi:hypothetical protein